jgi:hypothetical protein
MSAYPGFVGPSNPSQSPGADCERLVNLYYEPNDIASGKPAIYSTPGARNWFAVPHVGMRGSLTLNGRTFIVMGAGVYEVFSNGSAVLRGTVPLDGHLTPMVGNGTTGAQVAIVSAGSVYVLDLLTNLVSAAVLTGGVTQIGMLDGSGLAFFAASGKLQVSALNDFTTWDPSNFALRTGDVWMDVGTAPFPFAPRPGATFKYGIAAYQSLASAGDSVLWLTQNADGAGIVVQARGFVPQPVSSLALEAAIASYAAGPGITDAEALVFQWKGHIFYVLNFPAANATWAYDLRTGAWTELGQWNAGQNRYDAWHPSAITYAFGQHVIGERATSMISVLDERVGTEADGSPIRRLRIPPALRAADGGRLYVDRFELGIQRGLGTATGQGSDPVALLRISHDDGQTWGSESARSIGPMGQRDRLVFWSRLGSTRSTWVPELVISDPVPVRIVGASVQARGAAA